MNKLIPLISLLLPLPCMASPVTWDFVDTDSKITVASLTLTGPDSTGSARWGGAQGTPIASYTGDSFSFNFDFPHHQPLTPAFAPDDFGCGHTNQFCDFDIRWSESGGHLDAINVLVDCFDDSLWATLSSARIGSMGWSYAPCSADASCLIAGSWINAPTAASEPGNLALLAVGFGFWGVTKRYGKFLGRTSARVGS